MSAVCVQCDVAAACPSDARIRPDHRTRSYAQPPIHPARAAGRHLDRALVGASGYFVVLRGQVFAGDALSHAAYAGALAALAAGVDLRLGLFAATITVGLALGLLGGRGAAGRRRYRDNLRVGARPRVFFLAIYTTHSATGHSTANVTVLFGSILGISASAAATVAWIAAALIGVLLLLIPRPLLFASRPWPAPAASRGNCS